MIAALTSDTHYGYGKNTHIIHEKFWRQLASHKPDVLFHAGDISSYKQSQFQRSLYMMREFFPHIPIVVVRGNHCIWDTTLKALRQTPEDRLWNEDRYRKPYARRYPQIMQEHRRWFEETGIIHLDGGHYDLTPEIVVVGFDGWYHVTDPRERSTNDDIAICPMIESAPAMIYLREKAHKDLERVLNHPTDGKMVVGMTHIPPGRPDKDSGLDTSFWDDIDESHPEWSANPKYLDFLTEKCDYLLMGHTHQKCDKVYNGCRIINCGSDYDKPRYSLFELSADRPSTLDAGNTL